jgi:hypothetical protein
VQPPGLQGSASKINTPSYEYWEEVKGYTSNLEALQPLKIISLGQISKHLKKRSIKIYLDVELVVWFLTCTNNTTLELCYTRTYMTCNTPTRCVLVHSSQSIGQLKDVIKVRSCNRYDVVAANLTAEKTGSTLVLLKKITLGSIFRTAVTADVLEKNRK